MNVLLLTKRLAESPGEEGMIREMAKLGIRLTVMVAGGRWRGTSNGALKLKPEGYQLFVCNCPFSAIDSVRVRSHIYYYPQISHLIREEKWSLIHVEEDAYNLATFQVVRSCAKYRKLAIFRAQKGQLASFPFPFNYFESFVHRHASGAIVGNQAALSVLHQKGFHGSVAVVQDGTNPEVFRKIDASDLREKLGLAAAFVVGFAGQMVRRKGIDTLIRGFALLPKNCALVLVGSGPDVREFQAMVHEYELTKRIIWKPWADHTEIVQYMCAFDAFVLPSRTTKTWKEDFGRVLIEAMACETPVVGSDSGEIPNVIGDAGLIFHEGDERELAAQLLQLMDDPSLKESLGRRGRERVLERFTYEKVSAQTVAFYRHICNGTEQKYYS